MMVKGDYIDCCEIVGKLFVEVFENFYLKSMYQVIVILLNKVELVDMFIVKDVVLLVIKDFVVEVVCKCLLVVNICGWVKCVR